MIAYTVTTFARRNIAEIYGFTRRRWSEEQADRYLTSLYASFDRIATGSARSRTLDIGVGVVAQRTRHGSHDIWWDRQTGGAVVIRAVLHVRMLRGRRLQEAFD